jgi:WhiB family transcriptional regulator, redox-sensing transcriptional regulator
MINESWAGDAACREPRIDPDLFFPLGDLDAEVASAKAICERCPVTSECLGWALRTGEPDGVWGGTTPVERRQLRTASRSRVAKRAA